MSGVVSGQPGPTVAVIDSVERDWQEFQRLDFMGNHWERPGWAPGRRAYYWYITSATPLRWNLWPPSANRR